MMTFKEYAHLKNLEMIYMKLCSACKKNVAIIFTTKIENGKTEMNGLCIDCAKKMGIPVIDQLMQQTGMSKEDVDNLTEQMNGMFQDMDIEDVDSNNMFMNFLPRSRKKYFPGTFRHICNDMFMYFPCSRKSRLNLGLIPTKFR